MRLAAVVLFATSILTLILQCSENESLDVFDGKMRTVTPSITREYSYLPYCYKMELDSVIWLYEYQQETASRVSVILSGKIKTDSLGDAGDTNSIALGQNHIEVGVQTYSSEESEHTQLSFNDDGTFTDTIPVAVSSVSTVVLPQSSRLFVKAGEYITDTIPLVNPHGAKE